eukprot:UN1194
MMAPARGKGSDPRHRGAVKTPYDSSPQTPCPMPHRLERHTSGVPVKCKMSSAKCPPPRRAPQRSVRSKSRQVPGGWALPPHLYKNDLSVHILPASSSPKTGNPQQSIFCGTALRVHRSAALAQLGLSDSQGP